MGARVGFETRPFCRFWGGVSGVKLDWVLEWYIKLQIHIIQRVSAHIREAMYKSTLNW